jgi:hypothetical protein
MDVSTSGRFRVLGCPRDDAELLLIDVSDVEATMDAAASEPAGGHLDDAFDPVYVPRTGYDGPLADAVAALEPGNLVDATLAWGDGDPRLAEVRVVRRTVFEFVDGADPVFEAAAETWRDAVADGAAMNSRVTRGTDGEVNGVLYVFAKQPGARDLFAEFRDGATPLEPLVRRVNRGRETAERAVFVLRPREADFLVVYIALDRDGLLARTVRETYRGGATGEPTTGDDSREWDLAGRVQSGRSGDATDAGAESGDDSDADAGPDADG